MRVELQVRHERLGYAMLRLALGLNVMMHGVSRILMGPGEFAFKLQTQFANSMLPVVGVRVFGVLLPGIETLVGFLILTGLRLRVALVAASLLMMVLTFGSSMIQDWSAAGTQLMYAAILAALIALQRFDGWSVDAWRRRKQGGGD
jgi:thiosulfate dehydrogenase [quinone] large subunit